MARSTVHYADKETNNILKKLHNKLRPAGTPVQRVEYIIELLLLRIFEVKLVRDPDFAPLRAAFKGDNEGLLFSSLLSLPNDEILPCLNLDLFPFYAGILREARKVWRGNLSDKVQDQLVLIEEVFSNSNFTNNVTSGNMAEIIGLVAELDSERLLKTDLLGDAIESALSETGGTKDIGLHRTPDHIRQFMVGLAAPTFQSRLFDPTVGTGGFMFDSFEYVLEGVYREGHWPGPKSHPELAAWFKAWFERHPVPVPSIEVNTDFYRTGVGGIEYLGMVRKMAAINFYVRGLNPGNIVQGDALEKFGTEIKPNSKGIVLANPPFGAQRDKESYPNVWREYPTESETTILFVKLMLELIKPGGVCGVIVSEGFLTWDQNSARALRRNLLQECDLQAIISLPQGVFVSKGGQGPKTSILLFVKGRPTERVWFYKVTNDGYSLGTNRKPVPGCQLVEALDLFHTYVREGREPPESRHSFCIPAEWIKTLDPRIKDRIRAETRAEMGVKRAAERNKLEEKWAAQIAAKRLTEGGRLQRLAYHADLWQAKTESEITRRIERARLYSFNLPNYRSGLTAAQLDAWRAFAANQVRESEPEERLEGRYRAVAAAPIERLDELLSTLDPRHTLELDWAREFLERVSVEEFEHFPHLRTLQEIIASQARLPKIRLGELIHLSRDTVTPSDLPEQRFRVLGVNNRTGVFLNHTLLGSEIKQRCYRVKSGEFCYNPYRVNVGSIAQNLFDYDNQIISGAYVVFGVRDCDLIPGYLAALFKSAPFRAYVNEKASGGVRMNFKFHHLEDWTIPMPPVIEQHEIAKAVESYEKLIEGERLLSANYRPLLTRAFEFRMESLASLVREIQNGLYKPEADYGTGTRILRIDGFDGGDIITDAEHLRRVRLCDNELSTFSLAQGDLVLNRVNSLDRLGKVALVGEISEPMVYESNMMRLRLDSARILPAYALYLLSSAFVVKQVREKAKQAVNQYSINQSDVGELLIPIAPLDIQYDIVRAITAELSTLREIDRLSERAKESINAVITRIWES